MGGDDVQAVVEDSVTCSEAEKGSSLGEMYEVQAVKVM